MEKFSGFEVRQGTLDQNIVDNVYVRNEYFLPEDMSDVDLVVDIGAHIGAFSMAALTRGAKRVLAFEADLSNFELAQRNFGHCDMGDLVKIENSAVWRSDITENVYLSNDYSGHEDAINTGSKKISTLDRGVPVSTVSLHEVLNRLDLPDDARTLVKLDCEGAEWPILYSFQQFDRIYALCGEFHENSCELWPHNPEECTAIRLEQFLEDKGFSCHFTKPCRYGRGLFWALNKNGPAVCNQR